MLVQYATSAAPPQGTQLPGSTAWVQQQLAGRDDKLAQGVGVVLGNATYAGRRGVEGLYCSGNIGGFDASYYYAEDTKDVFVMVTTTTAMLFFEKYVPYYSRTKDGRNCTFALPGTKASPMPTYLCDARQSPGSGGGGRWDAAAGEDTVCVHRQGQLRPGACMGVHEGLVVVPTCGWWRATL